MWRSTLARFFGTACAVHRGRGIIRRSGNGRSSLDVGRANTGKVEEVSVGEGDEALSLTARPTSTHLVPPTPSLRHEPGLPRRRPGRRLRYIIGRSVAGPAARARGRGGPLLRLLWAGGGGAAAVGALLLNLQRPVENVVVNIALAVKEVAEKLAQVRVVGLVVEAQRAAKVEVGGKLRGEALAEHLDGRANLALADALVFLLFRCGL